MNRSSHERGISDVGKVSAQEEQTSHEGALPNVLVIGAQKAGTSSLHRYLDAHPEIAMSRPKELSFFMRFPDPTAEELDWYRQHFSPHVPVRGESSPNYTCYPQVSGIPERIHRLTPEAKLIYMVRDPIERAVSSYVQARTMGGETRPIGDALEDPSTWYVSRSLYFTQLEQYLPFFPSSQILVLAQETLLTRREEAIRQVFRFLGVDDSFSSPEFERMWEVSSGKGRRYRVAYRVSRWMGGPDLWGRLPTSVRWLGERLIYRPQPGTSRPQLDAPLQARLVDRFREDVQKLRAWTGQDFPDWSV